MAKINKVFSRERLNISEELVTDFKDIFKNCSWMFADEPTQELY
jgi:hypothetical protein